MLSILNHNKVVEKLKKGACLLDKGEVMYQKIFYFYILFTFCIKKLQKIIPIDLLFISIFILSNLSDTKFFFFIEII